MTDPVKMELRITFDGQNVAFFGPIHDKILCLGMIELAKQIVLSGAQVHKRPDLNIVDPTKNGHHPPS